MGTREITVAEPSVQCEKRGKGEDKDAVASLSKEGAEGRKTSNAVNGTVGTRKDWRDHGACYPNYDPARADLGGGGGGPSRARILSYGEKGKRSSPHQMFLGIEGKEKAEPFLPHQTKKAVTNRETRRRFRDNSPAETACEETGGHFDVGQGRKNIFLTCLQREKIKKKRRRHTRARPIKKKLNRRATAQKPGPKKELKVSSPKRRTVFHELPAKEPTSRDTSSGNRRIRGSAEKQLGRNPSRGKKDKTTQQNTHLLKRRGESPRLGKYGVGEVSRSLGGNPVTGGEDEGFKFLPAPGRKLCL